MRVTTSGTVLLLDFHIARLRESLSILGGNEEPMLHERVAEGLSCLLEGVMSATGDYTPKELMVTVLCIIYKPEIIQATKSTNLLHFHACEMPSVAERVGLVHVCGPGRTSPRAKDSAWCEQRKVIERGRDPGAAEALLFNDNGEVLEGLISNFFVVDHAGIVYSAPADVCLPGHMRDVVLEVTISRAARHRLSASQP
jgi:branched-subunit amino acid aminotransferase/4-amino-4-deoxychorismate lyase